MNGRRTHVIRERRRKARISSGGRVRVDAWFGMGILDAISPVTQTTRKISAKGSRQEGHDGRHCAAIHSSVSLSKTSSGNAPFPSI
jgi:hypothetical protein